ncbi:MAG: hypothetical protein AAF361_01260 [Bacteroidota bacterium]
MNVNINFNGNSLAMDNTTDDTTSVSDAGAPPSSLGISDMNEENNETSDAAAAESEAMDIGGPPEWLVQSMASTTETEGDSTTEDISDGGSGPTE